MKKTYFLFSFLLCLTYSIYSQNNNLIIYSQQGYKFTIILNGVAQNKAAETNVKITGLNAPNYQVKVIFANKSLPDIDQNIYFNFGGEFTSNTEYSYCVKEKSGKYKLGYVSAAPIPAGEPKNPEQTIVIYQPYASPVTTTTTQTTVTSTNENAMMNVNMPGVNINVNTGMPSSTTTTTYSSTTTTSAENHHPAHHDEDDYVLEGYHGKYGCRHPMNASDFESAKKSIASKSFDDSRLTIAKEIIGSNCMLCSQIKELMMIMSFEQTRLDLAKFAWHHNLDQGNYYKLNDAFTFESSIDELNKYTESH